MRTLTRWLFACLATAAVPTVSLAAEKVASEYQIKAAFLYKFLDFVESSSSEATNQERICVVGTNPFGDSLERLVKVHEAAHGPVEVAHYPKWDAPAKCTIVYIARSMEDQIETILVSVKGTGALTVSDIPNFATRGGIIELAVEDRTIRFIINQERAKRDGVVISSQLLALAKEIVTEPSTQ